MLKYWLYILCLNSELDRYIWDDNSQLLTFRDEFGALTNGVQDEESLSQFSLIPSILKEFVLPAGFPGR